MFPTDDTNVFTFFVFMLETVESAYRVAKRNSRSLLLHWSVLCGITKVSKRFGSV